MSSPHVAGLAALMMDKYPTWSPMRVKSALMTSANDVLDGANTDPVSYTHLDVYKRQFLYYPVKPGASQGHPGQHCIP